MYFLNPNSGIPLYVQLQQQIQQRILTGKLAAGEQMPSVRELSAQLKVNPLTISKVYQNLERKGMLETQRGTGTFVARSSATDQVEARREQLIPAIEHLVTEAGHLGMGEQDLLALVGQKYRQLNRDTDNPESSSQSLPSSSAPRG